MVKLYFIIVKLNTKKSPDVLAADLTWSYLQATLIDQNFLCSVNSLNLGVAIHKNVYYGMGFSACSPPGNFSR